MTSMRAKLSPAALLQPAPTLCLGQLVQVTDDGKLLVRLAANDGSLVAARLSTPHDLYTARTAIAEGHSAVLARVDGCEELVILNFLVPATALAATAPPPPLERRADRIVLRAGRAKVTLHNNGKITVRGVRIVSQAKEDYRVMGRTIRLN